MESPHGVDAIVSAEAPVTGMDEGPARHPAAPEVGGSTRLIVFFVPPEKEITGGLLSIFSIAETTRSMFDLHGATVQLCVYPGFQSYGHNELFDNDENVLTLEEIMEWGVPDYLQLHIPVHCADAILDALDAYTGFLESVPVLTVNLLNQNILLMPDPVAAARWFALTPVVTQTTAHDRYATQEVADLFDIPLHHFSAYLDPSQYEKTPYAEKSNIIVLSADANPDRQTVVDRLAEELPGYELVTVVGMSYGEYKDLVARAKFAITFGEGFDGYYIEPCFSGGVSFTVYNDIFFPHAGFAEFENVYRSYDEMAREIVGDIKRLDNAESYGAIVDQNFAEIAKFYDHSTYVDNVRRFYLGEVTFTPGPGSATRLLGRVAAELAAERTRSNADAAALHAQLDELRRSNELQKRELVAAEELRAEVERLREQLASLEATRLMRYSKPYRSVYAYIRNRVLGVKIAE